MPVGKTAVCLFVRDEERDIAEWLAWQFATRFDTVLVYDNGSVDRTPDIVRAFGKRFDVRLIDWPNETEASQARCYVDCFVRFGSEFNWVGALSTSGALFSETLCPRARTRVRIAQRSLVQPPCAPMKASAHNGLRGCLVSPTARTHAGVVYAIPLPSSRARAHACAERTSGRGFDRSQA